MFKKGQKVLITGRDLGNQSVGYTGIVEWDYMGDRFCDVKVDSDPKWRPNVIWGVAYNDLKPIGNILNE